MSYRISEISAEDMAAQHKREIDEITKERNKSFWIIGVVGAYSAGFLLLLELLK